MIMNKIEQILGFRPSRGMKANILRMAKEQGKPVAEIASEMALPDILIAEDDNLHFMVDGKLKTQEQIEKQNPYSKKIFIKTTENE